jgi:hypothetical protein
MQKKSFALSSLFIDIVTLNILMHGSMDRNAWPTKYSRSAQKVTERPH